MKNDGDFIYSCCDAIGYHVQLVMQQRATMKYWLSENKENTVTEGYTITDITGPVEVQSQIEQQGGGILCRYYSCSSVLHLPIIPANDITDP